jgi:hypothetical protein
MPLVRTLLYKATGLSHGYPLIFNIYRLGRRRYEVYCSNGRPRHLFEAQHNLDPETIRTVLSSAYEAAEIRIVHLARGRAASSSSS